MTTVPETDRSTAIAIAAAYDELRPALVRIAYLLTSDVQEASDLVQDAFEAALPRWAVIDDPMAYLRRAVTNRAYNATRNRTRRQEKAERAGHEQRADAPDHEYLGDLIAALPPRQRAVVVLRFHLDLSYDEIAGHLGVRPGSVGPTLRRALDALDQELNR
jgi:RNA polymerase sigma factor (sigma-70 family)